MKSTHSNQKYAYVTGSQPYSSQYLHELKTLSMVFKEHSSGTHVFWAK